MGNRTFKRLLVLCLTVVMLIASSMPAIAATTTKSPTSGETEKQAVIVRKSTKASVAKKQLVVRVAAKNSKKYVFQYKLKKQSWSKAKKITTTVKNATLKKLTQGGLYDIRVAGVNSKGKQGSWSTVTYRLMNKTAAKVSSNNGKVVVTLPKTKGATGYQIKYSLKSDFSNAKIVGQKASCTRRTISGLKKGKTYYVRVTPYAKYGSKVYWGQMTTYKVKVK